MKIYTNGKIVTGGCLTEGKDIFTDNGKIIDILPAGQITDGEIIDLKGRYIAPGFIDIHCHGGGGAEFIDGTCDAFKTACKVHSDHGTRVIFPTVSATDYNTMYKALEACEKVKDDCDCRIYGMHLEEPYLSKAMAGGQAGKFVTKPVKKDYESLVERFGSIISRWTYAPEEDDDDDFLKYIVSKGVIPSTGHSAAEYSDILSAFEYGNSLVTHLYSCTSTVTRHQGFRHLGVIESTFLIDEMNAEVIADGKHLPPELLKMIVKIKGTDKVAMITDSLRPAGSAKEGDVYSDCAVPFIIEDGVAKLTDRSAFAGSIATADVLLKNAVSAGFSVAQAVEMLTETPAKIMKLDTFGKIEKGYDSLFTIFDENLEISAIR